MLTTYKVKLDVFEGPLDLLLFLIRQEEVSIQDIPIASITKQYLEYIQLMRLLDLDIAGDFIVMASTLIRIKARMLLPQSPAEESEEAGDPRTELVQNLLEYQEYKKLAENLDERQNTQRDIFYRFMPPEQIVGSDDDEMIEVSLFDLLAAFKEAMDAAPEEVVHQVQRPAVSVEERITFLIEYLQEKKRVQFFDMFPKGTVKLVLVVTFVALLELIKRQSVRIGQSQAFGDIWLYWHEGGEMPVPEEIGETSTLRQAQGGASSVSEEAPLVEPITAIGPDTPSLSNQEEPVNGLSQDDQPPAPVAEEGLPDPTAIAFTLCDQAELIIEEDPNAPQPNAAETGQPATPAQTEHLAPEQVTQELTIMPASDDALPGPLAQTNPENN